MYQDIIIKYIMNIIITHTDTYVFNTNLYT